MNSHCRDFYADLGVSSSASADQIRHAYHDLVKLYHPDVNKDHSATERFRNITEAYDVLRDPERRRAYDSDRSASQPLQAWSHAGPAKEHHVEPIRCSMCGAYTALPQSRKYRYVVGFIFATRIFEKTGIYCTNCASKAALNASLLSSALGWWGLPLGPIRTITEIVRNARGGQRNPEADEKLQWHNAVAFLGLGNLTVSIALASRLRSAQNKDIREKSKKLYNTLIRKGIKPRQFREPWASAVGYGCAQLISGALVPCVLLFLLVNHAAIDNSSYSNKWKVDRDYSYSNICQQKPLNGTIMESSIVLFPWKNLLTIINETNGDAIVKIRNPHTGQLLMSFFVTKGNRATIKGIEDGNYNVQYAIGTALNESCSRFRKPSAYRFPEVQTLITRRTNVGTGILTQPEQLSLTLYNVARGNLGPRRISDAEFNDN